MASVTQLQGISIVLIFLIALAGGSVPWLVKSRSRRGRDFLAVASAFSAGVFLGAGLLHMLAEGNELLEEAMTDQIINISFPLSFVLCGAGYFVSVASEILVLGHAHRHVAVEVHKQEDSELEEQNSDCLDDNNLAESYLDERNQELRLKVITLAVVLGIHSVLAGLALGFSSSRSSVGATMGAIVAHKLVDTFSFGVSLQSATKSLRWYWFVMVLFSLITPIGVGVGMAIIASANMERDRLYVGGIVQAFASGAFIYVATSTLAEALEQKRLIILKLILSLFGFSIMTVILLVE